MEFIKNRDGLILPVQKENHVPQHNFNLIEVDAWRRQLPLSNLAASAQALYIFLQDLHQTPLKTRERFTLISHLRPTLSYLGEVLAKLHAEREVLSTKQQLIANLVNALYFSMLNEYKIIIDQSSNSFFKKKILIASLYNAMICCEKMLFDAYKQHREPPPGIWLELHTLYLLAKKKRIHNKALNKWIEWQTRFKTLEDLYKNCLLFVISNPYRLSKSEISNLIYALEVWAPLLVLKPINESSSGLYVLDMELDTPPLYSTLHPNPSSNSFILILDKITLRLEKLLLDKTISNENKTSHYFLDAEQMLPQTFIESILNTWQYAKERAQQRDKTHGIISVCLGISACHWFISEHLVPSEARSETLYDLQVIDLSQDQQEQKSQSYRNYHCQLIDHSEGGYCLQWSEEIPSQLQCGEIIAVQKESPDQNKTWVIGTIRWLRHEKDNTILFGVQILSQQILAVHAFLEETQYPTPTLLLAEEPLHNKPTTLITPLLPFKSGQEISITFENKIYPTLLQKNYSLSPCYQQFGIEFLLEQLLFPQVPQPIHAHLPL